MRSNEEWVDLLSQDGELTQHTAFIELGRILYGVTCVQVRRRASSLPGLAALSQPEQDELSRDFVQEALSQIYAHLHQYRGEGAFLNWAATITLRIMGQELRRAHWQSPRFDPTQEEFAPVLLAPDRGHAPEQHLMAHEMARAILRAVEEDMSIQQRRAFLARFVDGCTSAEIAAAEGATVSAIYQRIHQARTKVKQRIIEAGFDESELE